MYTDYTGKPVNPVKHKCTDWNPNNKTRAHNENLAMQPNIVQESLNPCDIARVPVMRPVGYEKCLRISCVPVGANKGIKPQTVGFIGFRRSDDKRIVYVVSIHDMKLHRTNIKLPQTRHVNIPALAKALGINKSWNITLAWC